MNSTSRFMNRLLLLIVALLLLAAGAAAVALVAVPSFASAWGQQARSIRGGAPAWTAATVTGGLSGLGAAVGAVALVLLVLLAVFVLRQGGGRTSRVVEQHHGDSGSTLVDIGVPRRLLEEDLAHRPEFVAIRVGAYRVRRTPTLKISVQCRRGVSPTAASRAVTDALEGLDAILGARIPALVQVSGGFRSRTTGRARLG